MNLETFDKVFFGFLLGSVLTGTAYLVAYGVGCTC
jgi:hypothetical protein